MIALPTYNVKQQSKLKKYPICGLGIKILADAL